MVLFWLVAVRNSDNCYRHNAAAGTHIGSFSLAFLRILLW